MKVTKAEVEVKVVNTNDVPVVSTEQMQNEIALQARHEVVAHSSIMQNEALGHFYSMVAETKEQKIALYNAINTPDARIGDAINMTIAIKDLLVEIIELPEKINEIPTGRLIKVPRTIIVDDAGKTYQCVSVGVFSSLKRIINL